MIIATIGTNTLSPRKLGLKFARYVADNSLALQLVDPKSEEPWMMATVCVDGSRMDDDHLLIKDWSENMGILASLVKVGIIEEPCEMIATGYCHAMKCRLLVKPDKMPKRHQNR